MNREFTFKKGGEVIGKGYFEFPLSALQYFVDTLRLHNRLGGDYVRGERSWSFGDYTLSW